MITEINSEVALHVDQRDEYYTRNGILVQCPFAHPIQHVVPPKLAGQPPQVRIIRPNCGNYCPLYSSTINKEGERETAQIHITCGNEMITFKDVKVERTAEVSAIAHPLPFIGKGGRA